MEKVSLLSLSVMLTLLYLNSSAQLQEKQLIQIFDHNKSLCLEKIISVDNNSDFRFFSLDKSYSAVQVIYDGGNQQITDFEKLKNFYEASLQIKDSTTFIICFYVKEAVGFKEWRILYNNDFACLSEFERRIKIDNALKSYINKSIGSTSYKKPFLFIKEWSCSTTPLWSTFGN